MRVIIAGGRDFSDYADLERVCDFMFQALDNNVQIVSGGAKGADALGEQYANKRGYSVVFFRADWDKHGKAAGPIRNRRMAEYADALIAFWDGKSRGTKNMIDEAKANGLKYRIVRY